VVEPNLEFGTDNLQDRAAKLTKIYLRVKSKGLDDSEYRHTNIYCTISDAEIIDLFARIEGNKRVAVTALVCAGLSKLYPKLTDFPVPLFDIGQVLGRIVLIDGVDWVLEDRVSLKISDFRYRKLNTTRYGIYLPEEIWGIVYRISIDFRLTFTSILLYLIRTGISEYDNFIKRFSSSRSPLDKIPYEYLEYAEKAEKMLMQTLNVRYNDSISRIKYLYNTYIDVLDDGHEDLKEEMKRIIDKST